MTRRGWRLLAIVSTAVLLAAVPVPAVVLLWARFVPTEPQRHPEFVLVNRTSGPLTVTVAHLYPDTPTRDYQVAAHGVLSLDVYPCRGTGATAVTTDGRTIATLAQPLCTHGLWVIEPNGRGHLEDES